MITICIAEDEKHTRSLLETIIGYEKDLSCIGSFENGRDAIQYIPERMPDIVLMDIEMPFFNGIEVIKRLKPLHPLIQFMVWTVFDEEEKVFDSLKAGATSYLLKRSTGEQLVTAIKELHQGSSPMSGDIARKVVAHFQKKSMIQDIPDIITNREKEVLELLAHGHSYNEVGEKLFISSKTVRKHTFNIYEKLQVNSRMEAVNKYYGGAYL
jgi:two-component system, NarL family, response regulator LiaR